MVGTLRIKLSGGIRQIERLAERGGTVYPMNVDNIGKSQPETPQPTEVRPTSEAPTPEWAYAECLVMARYSGAPSIVRRSKLSPISSPASSIS